MTKDEALNIAIDYMNERLEEHDSKFQRHPATEAERNNILADIEAVKEALAQPEQEPVGHGGRPMTLRECMEAEEPEQEPVAWEVSPRYEDSDGYFDFTDSKDTAETLQKRGWTITPLYTTPPQRKPLTDEQKDRLANAWFSKDGDTDVSHRKAIALIEEVEAAHGIKGEA